MVLPDLDPKAKGIQMRSYGEFTAAGDSHSAALDEKGTVFAWGTFRGESGVFGFAPGTRIALTPTAVVKPTCMAEQVVKIASGTLASPLAPPPPPPQSSHNTLSDKTMFLYAAAWPLFHDVCQLQHLPQNVPPPVSLTFC